jgi:hypothetical protein
VKVRSKGYDISWSPVHSSAEPFPFSIPVG